MLFREIVSRCEVRIRCRLGFQKSKSGKPRASLQEGIQQLCAVCRWEDEAAQVFVQKSRKLIACLKSYETHQVLDKLINIVDEAYAWREVQDMSQHFKQISSKVLNPQRYTHLRNAIRKVGQYRTASKRLSRLARSLPGMRMVKVTMIDLPQIAFDRCLLGTRKVSLAATIKHVRGSQYKPKDLDRFCQHSKMLLPQCQSSFESYVARSLGESKIHAEVQILAYLRTSKSRHKAPRVVQSSKKACYLCNMLFRLSSDLHIMKSHGRLYEAWRLPMLPNLGDLQTRLNNALEEQIKQSMKRILQNQRKISYPEPCESSILSALSRPSDIIENADKQQQEHQRSSVLSNLQTEGFFPTDRILNGTTNSVLDIPPELTIAPPRSYAGFESLEANATSLAHRSRLSEVWIKYTLDQPHTKSAKALQYAVKTVDEAAALRFRQDQVDLIDEVASLQPGTEMLLPNRACYLLDFGSEMVELNIAKHHLDVEIDSISEDLRL